MYRSQSIFNNNNNNNNFSSRQYDSNWLTGSEVCELILTQFCSSESIVIIYSQKQ
jgi:hypothetical protein